MERYAIFGKLMNVLINDCGYGLLADDIIELPDYFERFDKILAKRFISTWPEFTQRELDYLDCVWLDEIYKCNRNQSTMRIIKQLFENDYANALEFMIVHYGFKLSWIHLHLLVNWCFEHDSLNCFKILQANIPINTWKFINPRTPNRPALSRHIRIPYGSWAEHYIKTSHKIFIYLHQSKLIRFNRLFIRQLLISDNPKLMTYIVSCCQIKYTDNLMLFAVQESDPATFSAFVGKNIKKLNQMIYHHPLLYSLGAAKKTFINLSSISHKFTRRQFEHFVECIWETDIFLKFIEEQSHLIRKERPKYDKMQKDLLSKLIYYGDSYSHNVWKLDYLIEAGCGYNMNNMVCMCIKTSSRDALRHILKHFSDPQANCCFAVHNQLKHQFIKSGYDEWEIYAGPFGSNEVCDHCSMRMEGHPLALAIHISDSEMLATLLENNIPINTKCTYTIRKTGYRSDENESLVPTLAILKSRGIKYKFVN